MPKRRKTIPEDQATLDWMDQEGAVGTSGKKPTITKPRKRKKLTDAQKAKNVATRNARARRERAEGIVRNPDGAYRRHKLNKYGQRVDSVMVGTRGGKREGRDHDGRTYVSVGRGLANHTDPTGNAKQTMKEVSKKRARRKY